MNGLIRSLLPEIIAVAEGPFPDLAEPLPPEEAVSVARAVPERAREFAAGRTFARIALASLGATADPLPAGPNRAPIWPRGFVGSITHVVGYAAVAVGRARDIMSVGVDIEDSGRFDPVYVEQIFSPRERLLYLPSAEPPELRRVGALVFSAKEAVYKALSALGEVRIRFADCTIAVDSESGAFAAHLPSGSGVPGWDGPITGRFAWSAGLVGTAVILQTGGRAARG